MYPFRKELVGKRFLCVRDSRSNSNRPNSRSNKLSNPLDYQWKCGIIRACTEQDSSHPDQKVLVEYDNEEWTTREWLPVYSDVWKLFLVEKNMVWAQRYDPGYPGRRSLLWPALTFYPLVDKHGLDENQSIGVEFLGDHVRAFCQANEMRSYQEDDGLQPALRNNNKVVEELVNWQTLQKSQGILIYGPFTLTGFRVQVYREKCRQWFSAVITSHDLISREMDVMDDTVLQTHRINPRLVMVLLLANEVELDSMLRGDLVRVLPVRRNRQSQVVITSSYTSTTPTSTPGNSMWHLLNNMWRDPPSTPPVQRQALCSPPINMSTAAKTTTLDDERRTSGAARNNKRQESRDPQPATDKEMAVGQKSNLESKSCTYDSLEQDRKGPKHSSTSLIQQEHENSTKNIGLQKSSTSPVRAPFHHSSPLRSPITSPALHYQSTYSSLESLSNSSPSPQNMSPQRSFGSPRKSSPLPSSSTLLRASPLQSNRSPPKILDHQQPHFSSPHHALNQTPPKRQYTPPSSSSSFSPLRSNKLSPVLSSPSMHGHISLQNSGPSPSCMSAAGHSHDPHQMMGAFSHSTRQSPPNVLTSQLYALQLQQQRQLQNQQFQQIQHEQIISQYYMQMNQLQQMADQLKSCQQGTLSHEQSEMLNIYYNQIMSQYQQASVMKYHSAAASQESTMMSDQQVQMLREQMQLKFLSDQQKQDNYKWLHTGPEKDHFQSMLSHMQQYSNMEHLQKLCGEFTHKKSKESVQQHEDDSIKDHVARLKKFIPNKQEQSKANSQTARSTSSPSLSTKPNEEAVSLPNSPSSSLACLQSLASSKESTTSTAAVVSILPLMQPAEKADNKTDDQKVVDALVRKPSVSECPSTSTVENNKSAITLLNADQENKTSIPPQTQNNHTLEDEFSAQEIKKTEVSPKKDDDPFGFNSIGDDVRKESSPAAVSLDKSSDITSNKSSTTSSSKNKTKGKKAAALSKLTDQSVKHSHGKSSCETGAAKSDTISNRESVIKYVVNKSEPLVSSLNISNKETSLVDTETLPFSVDQLLEFHKTSAQEAVKIFEETNEMVEPQVIDTNQKLGKKRKKEGTIEDRDNKEIPKKKSAKSVKQSKKSKKVGDSKQEGSGCLENKSTLDASLDSISKGDDDDCKRPKAKNSPEPPYTFLRKINESYMKGKDGLKDQQTSETLHTEINSNDNTDLRQDPRSSNQLSSADTVVSRSNITASAFPVNFVADQTVRTVTAVTRATEPVLASSLCGTEYIVEQIETYSEASADSASLKSEPSRKRKKSRKVLENELLLEQDIKLKEEEKEKSKKKLKSDNADKTETPDNVNQEEQEGFVSESKKKKKKKKSHKTNKEGPSEDSKGKEKKYKDTKKKKSKKTVNEKPADNVSLPLHETQAADSENKDTNTKEEMPNEMEKTFAQSSHQEMDGQKEDLQKRSVDGIHMEVPTEIMNQESKTIPDSIDPVKAESKKSSKVPTEVKNQKSKTIPDSIDPVKAESKKSSKVPTEVKNQEPKTTPDSIDPIKAESKKSSKVPTEVKKQGSKTTPDSIDPVKAESKKSSKVKKSHKVKNDKAMEGNMKGLTDVNKAKVKKEKKAKRCKIKEATGKEIKDTTTAEKEPESKKDDCCKGADKTDIPDPTAAADKKDESHQNDEIVHKTVVRKEEDTLTAPNNHAVNDEKNDTEQSMKVETQMDEEKKSEEVKKKSTGKKKTIEKTKSLKRKQDSTSEELLVHNKKKKVKEPAEEYFLQNSGCLAFSKLPRCRDCRDKEEKPSLNSQECCRFTLFRRLKKKKRSDKVQVAGFLSPENAEPDDFEPWVAHKEVVDILSKKEALYILNNVADEFCSLVKEEKGARALVADGSLVAYKRAVTGLREMCDACATTIFNIHWVCQKCGFGVCLDCYELRIKEKTMLKCGKKAFEFKWFNCMPGLTHQPKNLTIAQIIPDQVLTDLSKELHCIRSQWDDGRKCPCNYEPLNGNVVTTKYDNASIKEEPGAESCNTLSQLGNVLIKEELGAEHSNVGTHSDDACVKEIPGETQSENAHVREETIKHEVKQETKELYEGSAKPVKKTILERVRERLREKLEAQKTGSNETAAQEDQMKPESELEKASGVKTTQSEECSENTTRENNKMANDKGAVNMSSGLSLLMSYDSSSEDSPPTTPNKPSSSASSFNFNLGLLALVASTEQEKRTTEISNAEQQDEEQKQEKQPEKVDDDGEVKEKLGKGKMLDWFKKAEEEHKKRKEKDESCEETKSSAGESTSSEVTMESDMSRDQHMLDAPKITEECAAPHSLLCNGRLLRLHVPHHPGNQDAFAKRWKEGKPVLVSGVDTLLDRNVWSPQSFENEFGDELADVVNCRTGKTLENFSVGAFWKGFESMQDREKDSNGEPMLLKLKDWPPAADFSEKLPSRFKNLMDYIPLPEYTRRDGSRNLASRLPDFFVKPDLGPKMYNAYGSAAFPTEGTTNLHIDMSDAVNIMVYVGVPREKSAGEKERLDAIKAVDVACDEIQQQRVRRETARIGALWHIFEVDDADKIREFLHLIAKERKLKYPAHHDPIHDQCFYLDHEMRTRLKKEYNVEGYGICQCLGDGVFIPAGAPHQVRNLYSCIKIAEDFVSPERIGQCFKTTQEFRHLTDKHTNHEDKLQIKNIIYHAVKDAVYTLKHHDSQQTNNE